VEIADLSNLSGFGNGMPFFMPTEWGDQWMVATDPSGDKNQSIFKIFWFDVHSVKARLIEFDGGEILISPIKGEEFIRAELTGYYWDIYKLIEPRPLIRGERFYWMYSLTTEREAGVAATVLLDAARVEGETIVYYFSTRESFNKWFRGEGKPDSIPSVEEPTTILPLEEVTKE